jgi:hypothetical protein
MLIGVGLAIVLAQLIWTTMPIATAVSLIALGATMTTMRIGRITSSPWIVAVHLFVYACLYLFLVGATCDLASRGSYAGLALVQLVDLGASVGVMAYATQICVAALIRASDIP